jgi:hypothetical protein
LYQMNQLTSPRTATIVTTSEPKTKTGFLRTTPVNAQLADRCVSNERRKCGCTGCCKSLVTGVRSN